MNPQELINEVLMLRRDLRIKEQKLKKTGNECAMLLREN
jgi:hypothetical protein